LHVQTKRIVVQVDGVQVWEGEKGCEEGRESCRNFAQKSACEDVCEVCYLRGVSSGLVGVERCSELL
jgi:hypothetical protein